MRQNISVPCNASRRWSAPEKRIGRRVATQNAASTSPAARNRQATDTSGATTPSWKVITSHVDPQIAVHTANRAAAFMVPPAASFARFPPRGARASGRPFGARHAPRSELRSPPPKGGTRLGAALRRSASLPPQRASLASPQGGHAPRGGPSALGSPAASFARSTMLTPRATRRRSSSAPRAPPGGSRRRIPSPARTPARRRRCAESARTRTRPRRTSGNWWWRSTAPA